jgi:hypothetical protein
MLRACLRTWSLKPGDECEGIQIGQPPWRSLQKWKEDVLLHFYIAAESAERTSNWITTRLCSLVSPSQDIQVELGHKWGQRLQHILVKGVHQAERYAAELFFFCNFLLDTQLCEWDPESAAVQWKHENQAYFEQLMMRKIRADKKHIAF